MRNQDKEWSIWECGLVFIPLFPKYTILCLHFTIIGIKEQTTFAPDKNRNRMKKNEVFTKYDLEKDAPDGIQFDIMEMPSSFIENGNNPMYPHIHGFYQIIWFRKGTGAHYVDFKEYSITDNTLFFLSPGQIHYFDGKRDQEGIIIHFNESFLSEEGSSENVCLK